MGRLLLHVDPGWGWWADRHTDMHDSLPQFGCPQKGTLDKIRSWNRA